MFSKGEKIAMGIVAIEILGCFGMSVLCYARSQYYQGRIDATNEIKMKFWELKQKLENERRA